MAVARISVGVNSGNFVPYVNALADVNLGTKSLKGLQLESVDSSVEGGIYASSSDSSFYIGTVSNTPLRFFTNNSSTSMYIAASGIITMNPVIPTANTAVVNIISLGSKTNTFAIRNINDTADLFTVSKAGLILVNGATAPGGTLSTFRTLSGTATVDLGEQTATSGRAAMWISQSTPSATNYSVSGSSGATWINGSTGIEFRISNTPNMVLNSGTITFTNGTNLAFTNAPGSKIATSASQSFAFWGKTPIVQPTTAITGAVYSSIVGTPISSNDTFGGYTLQQLAAILINSGLAA